MPATEHCWAQVDGSLTVDELKGWLEASADIPRAHQQLLFQGKVLQGRRASACWCLFHTVLLCDAELCCSATLQACGVKEGDIVQLQRRAAPAAPAARPPPQQIDLSQAPLFPQW